MLRELNIENLAVIQKADICFSENLNIFTGETGAGKSVLVNSINAVLGQRIKKDIIRTGCEKAMVSALFTGIDDSSAAVLESFGIDFSDDEIIVSREIHSDGRSTARINGKAVTLAAVREIGENLINIHGQHDNQILLQPEKHLDIIDSFGGDSSLLDSYREAFRRLQLTARKLGELCVTEKNQNERIMLLKERIDEIGSLEINPDDDNNIDDELLIIQNSERIAASLRNAYIILNGDNMSNVSEMLMDCENEISDISEFSKAISELYERLSALRIEASDIADEFLKLSENIDFDRSRLEYLTERRSKLNHIMKKYNAPLSEICRLYDEAVSEMNNIEGCSDRIKILSDEKEKLLLDVTEKAKKLSAYREKTAEKFAKSVCSELEFLNMPDVILEVKHEKGKLTINGMDSMEILISANKGETPKSISKIASGGELSRIMLALKSVVADKDLIPTLIFDEIDTGVSGRAARKIGIKLKEISRSHQVICVTHLSQIAVMADNHLLIEKKTENDRTFTEVSALDFEGRVNEIARILSGDSPSSLMLDNAREELKKAMKV